MIRKIAFGFFGLLIISFFGLYNDARAAGARLFLVPDSGTFSEDFVTEIRLDTDGELVRGVTAVLNFDSGYLSTNVGSIDASGSPFDFTARVSAVKGIIEVSAVIKGAPVKGSNILVARVGFRPLGTIITAVQFGNESNESKVIRDGDDGLDILDQTDGALYTIQLPGTAPAVSFVPPVNGVPIRGWGWANVDRQIIDLTQHDLGVGWISLSSENKDAGNKDAGTDKLYGVYYDKDTHLLSGYAWSGIQCTDAQRAAKETCGFGWLSFNPPDSPDLVGCPSGECVARVTDDGKVYGWAKFLGAKNKGWDGWARLRGQVGTDTLVPPKQQGALCQGLLGGVLNGLTGGQACPQSDYGVCFGSSLDGNILSPQFGLACKGDGVTLQQGVLNGWAWGGDIVGWIKFYGGTPAGGTVIPLPAPTILDTSASCTTEIDPSDGKYKTQVLLGWANTQDYTKLEIYRKGSPDVLVLKGAGDFLKKGQQSTYDKPLDFRTSYSYRFEYSGLTKDGSQSGGKVDVAANETPFDSACNPVVPPECELQGVKISPTLYATIGLGDTYQFSAEPIFNKKTGCGPATISWSIDNKVRTGSSITQGGLFTADVNPPDYTEQVRATATFNGTIVSAVANARVIAPVIGLLGGSCSGLPPVATLRWSDTVKLQHSVRVMKSTDDGQTYTKLGEVGMPAQPGDQTLTDQNVQVGKDYWYRIELATGQNVNIRSDPARVSCARIDDVPILRSAIHNLLRGAGGEVKHFFHVTWEDRAAKERGHTFSVANIKVTPEKAEFGVLSDNARKNVMAGVPLTLQNKTTRTPISVTIERDEGNAFVGGYESDVVIPRDLNPTYNKPYPYNGKLTGGFSRAKTYYYRAKTCSTIGANEPSYFKKRVPEDPKNAEYSHNRGAIVAEIPEAPICTYSNILSVTTPPAVPTGLAAEATSSQRINLSWLKDSVADGYVVERKKAGDTNWSGVWDFSVDKMILSECTLVNGKYTCINSGLISDTQYYYRARAFKYDVEGRARVESESTGDAAVSAWTYFAVGVVIPPGDGGGAVTSMPAGINCGSTCSHEFIHGTSVILTATPDGNSEFGGWIGCPSASEASCTVTGTTYPPITAVFRKVYFAVGVLKSGDGAGIVSAPVGINCGNICSYEFLKGTSVTLNATPEGNSEFVKWDGCPSATGASCMVTVNTTSSITAVFKKKISNVLSIGFLWDTVNIREGKVLIQIANKPDCEGFFKDNQYHSSGSCTQSYENPTTVTLAPSVTITDPVGRQAKIEWVGCLSVQGTSCTVKADGYTTVTLKIGLQNLVMRPFLQRYANLYILARDYVKGIMARGRGRTMAPRASVSRPTGYFSVRNNDGTASLVTLVENLFGVLVSQAQLVAPDYEQFWTIAASNNKEAAYNNFDADMRMGDVYLYRARVDYGDGGTSLWSDEGSAYVRTFAPIIDQPPLVVKAWVVPDEILRGGGVLLSWKTENADPDSIVVKAVDLNGERIIIPKAGASGDYIDHPANSTSYVVVARNDGGEKKAIANVSVVPGPGTGGGGGGNGGGGPVAISPCAAPNPPDACKTECELNPNSSLCKPPTVRDAIVSLCVNNSICESQKVVWLGGDPPQSQCRTNANCRSVGASARTGKER